MPDPRPASASGTSAIATVSSGMNELPTPSPIAKQATKIVGKNAVCVPAVASSTSPTITAPMPPSEHAHRAEARRPAAR